MKHTLAVRRSEMLPVRTRLAFGEESACTAGRWAFGCSDTVMVNIVYRGSAHILLGHWIDANAVSPFLSTFWGCTPFCHPPLLSVLYTS